MRNPDEPFSGKAWLWVAEFSGHQNGVDDAMEAKGCHVAYVRVAD